MDLLTAVRAKQKELKKTDALFAAKLRVSKACWIKTREGILPIGMSVLCGIVQEFPDLQVEALQYMREWRRERRPRRAVA